ncbi:MAG: hypothetical protein IKD95_06765 [Bacteroidales bacterium]|nr:hypothetical protein [Bacteroidales bacterium]
MFQGLPQGASQIAQGATLYILNRKEFSITEAGVTAVSQPHISKSAMANPIGAFQNLVVDLTISINGDQTTIEFPVNSASASYPDKGWFVTPNESIMEREIESMYSAARQFMSQVPWNQMVLEKKDPLLMQIDSGRKAEAEQAKRITQLESQLAAMNGRLDQMVSLLSAANPGNDGNKEK